MSQSQTIVTHADFQSLAVKLADFDASLSPGERAIFRARIAATLPDTADVVGHRMELRWTSGPDGIFQTWVHIDDSPGSDARRTSLDPARWDTFSIATSEPSSAPPMGKKAEGTA
jgi:hypothetical protein